MTPYKEKKMATPSLVHYAKFTIVTIDPRREQIADPEPFRISKSSNEQVQWVAVDPEVYFTVEFEGESPFYESQFSTEAPYSGLVRRDVLGDPNKVYKYTIRTAGRTEDPGGVIDR